MYDVKLYKEDDKFCAYIGSDCSSGYECVADTPEECAEQIRNYFLAEWIIEENEWLIEEKQNK